MKTTYIGLVDGYHTWEVRDDSGKLIGNNKSLIPPCPGDGFVFDDAAGEWIEAAQN